VNPVNVLGVLSLVIWSLVLVVSVKYVLVILRADNRGEGGHPRFDDARDRPAPALVPPSARIDPPHARSLRRGAALRRRRHHARHLGLVRHRRDRGVDSGPRGMDGADCVGRSGDSVLGAATRIRPPRGAFFGPVALLWFVSARGPGLASIVQTPSVFAAFDPGGRSVSSAITASAASSSSGACFSSPPAPRRSTPISVTSGLRPSARTWFGVAFPALMLNYLGQGALLLRDARRRRAPVLPARPSALCVPVLLIATVPPASPRRR
jgi:KUP system potassium uptake protein